MLGIRRESLAFFITRERRTGTPDVSSASHDRDQTFARIGLHMHPRPHLSDTSYRIDYT
jgi:hypothetical protein